jgi:hypothetical protein
LILEKINGNIANLLDYRLNLKMTTKTTEIANENKVPPSPVIVDAAWLFGIALIMATSGIWNFLSPRPEIGKVAVLWLPNAVLAIALLRNWGRIGFCSLAVFIFIAVGLFPAVKANSIPSNLAFLILDIIEASILAVGLITWFGKSFRLNSAMNVGAFGIVTAGACLIGGIGAAIISQVPLGIGPIAIKAPLQVGVAWFTSDLATYFLFAAPLIALTGRGGRYIWSGLKATPISSTLGALLVMILTFIGYALPNWLAAKTGLALGSGGLILVAFPLATYLSFTRGPAIAALTGAAIGLPSIYATMAGIGPFGQGNAAANVFDMQATLVVSVFTMLLIGAMGDEMRARSNALERALDEAIKMRQSRH